jgi:cellulose synthase/poly-beta-1,6-N-acetylglucosamine synthase-like glycosyltransferase
MVEVVVTIVELCLLTYFASIIMMYIGLMLVALVILPRRMEELAVDNIIHKLSWFDLPVSVLVPAYNESVTIHSCLQSLLRLRYPAFEILVINDGSDDDTLDVLIDRFALVAFPEANQHRLHTAPVRTIYHSRIHSNLRVLDKENGGKADALNAGINAARYPLLCCVDADSMFLPDALRNAVRPFQEDPSTVACAGTIRVINGCRTKDGSIVRTGISRNLLVHFQILEYLRGFLFGRLAWSTLNSVPIVSGAFGLWNKEILVSLGGYRTDTACEDAEMTLRLHRMLRRLRRPYRIAFTAHPSCWTEVPDDLQGLYEQRRRWQRHIVESSSLHRDLLFSAHGGAIGWLGLPYLILFECISPLFEVGGLLFVVVTLVLGILSYDALFAFGLLGLGAAMLLSAGSLLLEVMSFRIYTIKQSMVLLLAAVLENLGYRQLHALWKLRGVVEHLVGKKQAWGKLKRKASWKQ